MRAAVAPAQDVLPKVPGRTTEPVVETHTVVVDPPAATPQAPGTPFSNGSFKVSGAFVSGTLVVDGSSATFIYDNGSAGEAGPFNYDAGSRTGYCRWRSGARLEIWVRSRTEMIATWFARDGNNFRCSVR